MANQLYSVNTDKKQPVQPVLLLLIFILGIGVGLFVYWLLQFDSHKTTTAQQIVVNQQPQPANPVEPTTKNQNQTQTILAVPYYRQEFRQSCEAASLRMALKYRGIDKTDQELLDLFGYIPKKRDIKNNIWDDPYEQFVGFVTGAQDKGEGYGVYAPAVAKVSDKVGRKLLAINKVSATQIAKYIYDGNPVIVWGYYNAESKADSWKTPIGKTIPAVIKAHVRLAYGVKGPASKPTGFYLHDPLVNANQPMLWSTTKFMDNLKKFGTATDQVVVVL
jgi:uncharacterized protein YvpB